MIRFNDATNIVITGTIISYTPKPKGQSGPPDSVEMQVDGYEPEVTRLLGRLRWTWTGWALIKDIWRVRKTMLIIPWSELPYLDSHTKTWQGFNATSSSVYVPKIDDRPAPVNMDEVKKLISEAIEHVRSDLTKLIDELRELISKKVDSEDLWKSECN